MKSETITAVNVAIIDSFNKLLIAKRPADKPMPNKWEFPGGKLEENETLDECGIREIKEELDVDIVLEEYLGFEELTHEGREFCLHLYTAYKLDDTQVEKALEHSELQWVHVDDLLNFDFPAFDLPFIEKLKNSIVPLN